MLEIVCFSVLGSPGRRNRFYRTPIGFSVLLPPFLKKKRWPFYYSCMGIIATAPVLPEAEHMDDQISFSQAIEGYLFDAAARKLSDETIRDYLNTFRKFDAFLEDDPPIARITPLVVKAFLAEQPVAKKTLLNYHVGLSALWTWALGEEIVDEHIIRKVRRPKPEKKAIKPYLEEEVRAMLSSLTRSKVYSRPGKRECSHKVRNAERNRAIILLLLDTGMRSSELCNLRIQHVDLKTRRLRVYGKGDKERIRAVSGPLMGMFGSMSDDRTKVDLTVLSEL